MAFSVSRANTEGDSASVVVAYYFAITTTVDMRSVFTVELFVRKMLHWREAEQHGACGIDVANFGGDRLCKR